MSAIEPPVRIDRVRRVASHRLRAKPTAVPLERLGLVRIVGRHRWHRHIGPVRERSRR